MPLRECFLSILYSPHKMSLFTKCALILSPRRHEDHNVIEVLHLEAPTDLTSWATPRRHEGFFNQTYFEGSHRINMVYKTFQEIL
jgi:hypothetical protein